MRRRAAQSSRPCANGSSIVSRHLRHRADRPARPRAARQPSSALAARGERGEQRLGHHRVADPLRRDDERAGHRRARRRRRSMRRGRFSPAFSRYTVPQYGHLPSPAVATSMKTRGWLLHSGIFGFGQNTTPGPCRSAGRARPSTLDASCCHGASDLGQPLGVLRVAAVDDVEERALDLLGDRAARAAPISMRSSSRIGVTSAAVPVKNASSPM